MGPEMADIPPTLTSSDRHAPFGTGQGLSPWPWGAEPPTRGEPSGSGSPWGKPLERSPGQRPSEGSPSGLQRACGCRRSA